MNTSQATGSDEPGPSSHPVDEMMHNFEEEELVDYELSHPDDEEPGVPSSAVERVTEGAAPIPTPVPQASESHDLTDTVHSLISEVKTLRSAAEAVSSLTELVQELKRDIVALGKRKTPEDTGIARPTNRSQGNRIADNSNGDMISENHSLPKPGARSSPTIGAGTQVATETAVPSSDKTDSLVS